jgi:arsenate reductase-like glutaredoxin family protein
MTVLVFGFKNCEDTSKVLRFFSERRVPVHFVDMNDRPTAGLEQSLLETREVDPHAAQSRLYEGSKLYKVGATESILRLR